MKKILIGTLLLPLYLFSSDTLKVSSSYDEGLSYYKIQNYQKSYDLLHSVYLDKLSDINFNFAFGRSAYETGHYEMALAAFERVQMQDASNSRNRLEMARTYFMLKMYEDSELAFKDVLKDPNIPKNIRKNIERSLSKVTNVQEKSFTYSKIMMNVLYDSNVNYGSISDYQYGGGQLSKIEERADIAAEIYANVTNIYDIGQKNGFAIKNSLSFYAKEYLEEDLYNTLYLSYSPSLLYTQTKYSAGLALGADVLFLGRTKYLNTFSLTPSVKYNHNSTLSSIANVKYQSKTFSQSSQKELDANRYELSYGMLNILSPRSYLQGNFLYANEAKKNSGNNIYVDYSEYKINTVYANQISFHYNLELFAQMRLRDYKDYSIGFNSVRKDVGALVNANISTNILPTLKANIKVNYEYVNSNQDRFTYAKYTISAGIVKTF